MFLLDTNIISYFLKGNLAVQKNFQEHIDDIVFCSIVCSECLFGARNSNNHTLLEKYHALFNTFKIYNFDFKVADIFSEIKNKLQKEGKPIADFDLIIASNCLANDLILVTNNTKDFQNIPNLKLENWL